MRIFGSPRSVKRRPWSRIVWLAALTFASVARTVAAQHLPSSVLGSHVRIRYSELSPWQRGVATAVDDTGLALRQGAATRFIPRDSIVYLERRDGKDWSAITYVAVVTSVLGYVVGDQLARRHGGGDTGAVGLGYGGLFGAADGALVGTIVGVCVVPNQWNSIDVGLVFRR